MNIPAKRIFSAIGTRYLIAGGCNTLFGICNTLATTKLCMLFAPSKPKLMGSIAILTASFCNIAFSFLTYKWFVFRTRGRYFQEYIRSLVIYLPSIALMTLAVAPLSALLVSFDSPIYRLTNVRGGAVYLAIFLLVTFSFTLSFFGHKHFSFKRKNESQ